ncbi:MAG: PfkB family carbohydrate kinase [Gemmatimonadales bacterium]
MFRQSVFDVQAVDTVACGDSFLAACLPQMVSGDDPQDALTLACAVGALVASRRGANPVLGRRTRGRSEP